MQGLSPSIWAIFPPFPLSQVATLDCGSQSEGPKWALQQWLLYWAARGHRGGLDRGLEGGLEGGQSQGDAFLEQYYDDADSRAMKRPRSGWGREDGNSAAARPPPRLHSAGPERREPALAAGGWRITPESLKRILSVNVPLQFTGLEVRIGGSAACRV